MPSFAYNQYLPTLDLLLVMLDSGLAIAVPGNLAFYDVRCHGLANARLLLEFAIQEWFDIIDGPGTCMFRYLICCLGT